jgi:hypothetical protein
MTAADLCRERGWEKGQLVLARYMTDWGGWEELVGRVTATGETSILIIPLGGRTSKFPRWYITTAAESIVDQFGEVTALDRLPWEEPNE